MTSSADEPLLPIARGDPALSRHLREALRTLRARSNDPVFRRLADEVLLGRRSLREAMRTPEFDRVLTPGVQEFARRWRATPDEERERLGDEAAKELQRQREEILRQQQSRHQRPRRPEEDDPDEWGGGFLIPVR